MTSFPRLNILIVTPDLPYPPSWGFGMRVYQLSRFLGTDNSVTILSYARPDEETAVDVLRSFCDVRVVPRQPIAEARRRLLQARSLLSPSPFHGGELTTTAMQAAIDHCLASAAFDIVQIESSQMAGFRFRTEAALVLDEHNIESELLERMRSGERSHARRLFSGIESRKHGRLERRAWKTVSSCVVTSKREEAILNNRTPGATTIVVPNGVDPIFFDGGGNHEVDTDSMVFIGVLSYRPNLDAITYFIEEVYPRIRQARPRASLTVVGSGSPKDLETLRGNGVMVTGWVPDVRPYLARAAAVVVPIRIGGGTRLKVLEALSMGKGVVSTVTGCEGLDVADGRQLLLANDPAAFAFATCRLLQDAPLRERLGRSGREHVIAMYSWRRSGEILQGHYRKLLENAKRWA
jgi:polysaccharide biosynthesis protein PslH